MEKIKKWIEQKLPHWDAVIFTIVLFYFALRLFFFATSIAPAIAPDEVVHTDLILLYSQYDGFVLPESPATAHLDLVTRRPHLYFWFMGKLLFLNFFQIPSFLFLRLLHALISIVAVLISFKFFRLLTNDKLVSLLGIIVLTNIPMYSFLAAFISYDNLLGLLAVSSFYLLFKFLKTRETKYLLATLITSLLGTLIKFTFLPLLAIFLLITVIDLIANKKQHPLAVSHQRFKLTRGNTLVLLIIAILLYLNSSFYLVNIFRYQKILPSCDQTLSLEQCMQKKNFQIEKKLSDSAKKIPKEKFLKVQNYAAPWMAYIEKTVLGIFGHKVMLRTSTALLPYNILFFLFFLLFIINFRLKDPGVVYCSLSVFIYAWVLFYPISYRMFYLNSGYVEAHLQGRYLFPVIYPIVFLFAYFMLAFTQKTLKILLFLIISLIFIWGDLPYFLKHADKSWYTKDSQSVQTKISQARIAS